MVLHGSDERHSAVYIGLHIRQRRGPVRGSHHVPATRDSGVSQLFYDVLLTGDEIDVIVDEDLHSYAQLCVDRKPAYIRQSLLQEELRHVQGVIGDSIFFQQNTRW